MQLTSAILFPLLRLPKKIKSVKWRCGKRSNCEYEGIMSTGVTPFWDLNRKQSDLRTSIRWSRLLPVFEGHGVGGARVSKQLNLIFALGLLPVR